MYINQVHLWKVDGKLQVALHSIERILRSYKLGVYLQSAGIDKAEFDLRAKLGGSLATLNKYRKGKNLPEIPKSHNNKIIDKKWKGLYATDGIGKYQGITFVPYQNSRMVSTNDVVEDIVKQTTDGTDVKYNKYDNGKYTIFYLYIPSKDKEEEDGE